MMRVAPEILQALIAKRAVVPARIIVNSNVLTARAFGIFFDVEQGRAIIPIDWSGYCELPAGTLNARLHLAFVLSDLFANRAGLTQLAKVVIVIAPVEGAILTQQAFVVLKTLFAGQVVSEG